MVSLSLFFRSFLLILAHHPPEIIGKFCRIGQPRIGKKPERVIIPVSGFDPSWKLLAYQDGDFYTRLKTQGHQPSQIHFSFDSSPGVPG